MRTALNDFQTEIARIDKAADWLGSPAALASDLLPAAHAISCGSVVLLSGYFESFLRDCMEAFIGSVNRLGHPLSKLPDKMRYTHFENGAKALVKALKVARRSSDTSRCEDLASRLSSLNLPIGYTLAWEAFADTEANPGPLVVAGLLGSVGVDHPWRQLRSVAGTGLGDLELFLSAFMSMRNECAHSGNLSNTPAAGDLLSYGQCLGGLGTAFVVVLEGRFAELAAL